MAHAAQMTAMAMLMGVARLRDSDIVWGGFPVV